MKCLGESINSNYLNTRDGVLARMSNFYTPSIYNEGISRLQDPIREPTWDWPITALCERLGEEGLK